MITQQPDAGPEVLPAVANFENYRIKKYTDIPSDSKS